jgi:protein-tyrosine phosphatase
MYRYLYDNLAFSRAIKDKVISFVYDFANDTLPEPTERLEPNQSGNLYREYLELSMEPTLITNHIYLGNAYNSANYEMLKELNIGLIVNVTEEIPMYFPKDFMYINYPIRDINDVEIKSELEFIIDKIYDYIINPDNNDKNVLVHCYKGASRSASIVIAYQLKYEKRSLDNIYQDLKEKRKIVNINRSFWKSLSEFEEEISRRKLAN